MIFEYIIGCLGVLTSLYGVYFVILALLGDLKRKRKTKVVQPITRFALVVAARNESAVIGNLIISLQQQNYPKDLYDIYVAPNNCTDNTRQIAISHGAKIFDPKGDIRSKGNVLSQFVKMCMKEKKYDAICVFDADNIVHPEFLQKMNNEKLAGAHIAQGFKNSKNPADSAVAASFSIYYWIIGRFYNASREALGLSSFITGSGFMVTISFFEKIGGWNTRTITEDYEFSAQCVLAGERVHYVPDAIVYDEQPLTFEQSWKQRRRWSTGYFECSKIYLQDLVKNTVGYRSIICLDLTMTYIGSVIFILSLIVSLSQIALTGFKFYINYSTGQLQFISTCLFLGIIFCVLLASYITYKSNRQTIQGFGKGIVFFILLIISWIPINIVSLFKKQRVWEAIAHTRALTLNDL
jgi:cellulose synthase/poly-beta-1,6-N-acetylglucosamine synthase-like glycosyltransferase